MKDRIRRWALGLVLIGQIVLYIVSVPHMAPAAVKSNLGGTTGVNTFIFDATGVIFWSFIILLYEGDLISTKRVWPRNLAILLCAFAWFAVVMVNVHALVFV